MDISHKYCYTNFEQLNIDFLLESVADHSNKITQLRTDLTAETAARTAEDAAIRADLQTEINTRIADVEVLTAEDEALTAFANAIQADLNQEISDRTAAVAAEAAAREAAIAAEAATRAGDVEILTEEDANLTAFANQIQSDLNQEIAAREAISPVLFHLSYGQGGVLDCLPDEANDIVKAFDASIRAAAQFTSSGEWFERISIGKYSTLDRAVFVQINNLEETSFTGKVIVLTHVTTDDTHAFAFHNYDLDTAAIEIDITSSSNDPDVSATFTTSENLWDVEKMDKNVYIKLTCPGNYPTRYYTRSSSIISDTPQGSYYAEYVFSYWNLDTRYDIDIVLSKPDVTDPSTWTATMTGRKKTYETVS